VADHSATASINKDKDILALPACCLMTERDNTREMPVDNNKERERRDSVEFTAFVIWFNQPDQSIQLKVLSTALRQAE